jgi:hypothetical protein
MTNSLLKPLLGGVAVAAIVALTPMTGAHAQVRCSSDGWRWHCTDYGPAPTPAPRSYGPGWSYDRGADYGQAPTEYPGPGPDDNSPY